jgi:hypothetical protein
VLVKEILVDEEGRLTKSVCFFLHPARNKIVPEIIPSATIRRRPLLLNMAIKVYIERGERLKGLKQ